MCVTKVQPAVELVVLLVKGTAGDQNSDSHVLVSGTRAPSHFCTATKLLPVIATATELKSRYPFCPSSSMTARSNGRDIRPSCPDKVSELNTLRWPAGGAQCSRHPACLPRRLGGSHQCCSQCQQFWSASSASSTFAVAARARSRALRRGSRSLDGTRITRIAFRSTGRGSRGSISLDGTRIHADRIRRRDADSADLFVNARLRSRGTGCPTTRG